MTLPNNLNTVYAAFDKEDTYPSSDTWLCINGLFGDKWWVSSSASQA